MKNTIFYRIIEFCQRHAWLIIILTIALTAVLGYFMVHIRVDPDIATLSPEDDSVTKLTEKYGEQNKGGDYLIVVARGPNVFTPESLSLLKDACDKLGALPGAHPGITPFTFPIFEKRGGRLIFGSALEGGKMPATQEEAEAFRQRLYANGPARNMVISKDGTGLAAYMPSDMMDDCRPLLKQAEAIIAPLSSSMDIRLSGTLPFSGAMLTHVYGDLPIFLGLALAIILISYYFSFRTMRSVILPILVVVLGTVWTVGTMTLMGFKLSILMIMTPPLVLILGSSYSLHTLNQYYRDTRGLARGGNAWIAKSVSRVSVTVFLASITTVFGFLSLCTATFKQARQFGVATALGIAYCSLLALFFLPAVLSLLTPPTIKQTGRVREGGLAKFLVRLADLVMKYRWGVLVFSVVIVVAFIFIVPRIRYETDYTKYFRYREPAVDNYKVLLDNFTGFEAINLTLEAPEGSSNYFSDPAVLASVARLEDRIASDLDVKYVLSFDQFLRSMNGAMTGSTDVPATRGPLLLLSKYLAAVSATPAGKAIAGNMISRDFSRYTISIHIWDHKAHNLAFEETMGTTVSRIQAMADSGLPKGVSSEFWGGTLTLVSTSQILKKNMVMSIFTSALLVFIVAALVFRSPKHGAIVLAPLAFGIALDFIFMQLFSIKLDLITVSFTSIAIGIGVDNAIHLTVWYRRQRRVYPHEPEAAIRQTMKIAGRPMLLTTVSIGIALLVFVFSSFTPIVYFGVLIALSLMLTTAGALLLLPALLYFEGRNQIKRHGQLSNKI